MSSQVNKNYGNDEAKSRSRDLVRSMIEYKILDHKDPKDVYAVCLPGKDAAEIAEVYDQLSIPRENIVGIEISDKVADIIEGKDLGIQVYRGSVEDYFGNFQGNLADIVSIDYTGPVSDSQLELVQKIRNLQGKQDLILHHANLAKRDPKSRDIYRNGSIFSRIGRIFQRSDEEDPLLIGDFGEELQNAVIEGADYAEKMFEKKKGKEVREESYSSLLHYQLFAPGVEEVEGAASILAKNKNFAEDVSNGDSPLETVELVTDLHRRALTGDGRILDGHKGYYYVSESSDPMIGDVFHIKYSPEMVRIARNSSKILQRPMGRTPQQIRRVQKKALRKFLNHRDSFESYIMPREHLGSSARPQITKELAIQDFRDGLTVEEVRDKYLGTKNKPLAQWKAHTTMRTYDEKPAEETITPRSKMTSREVTEAELEVKELLSSGESVKDVQKAFPQFSIRQVSAWKAWDTMRKRKSA